VLSEQNNENKPSIKRQKLATGKKKPKSEVIQAVTNIVNEDKKESTNPFKDFIENISDKSRELANTVIKERDEIFAKLNRKGKIDAENQNKDIKDYTIKQEAADDHSTQDYLGDVMKISQLSQELTRKTEYLEKAESKIISIKSELNNLKITLSNRENKCKELEGKVESHKSTEKDLNQQITDLNNHINFLQLENTMFSQQRQKLLNLCPEGIEDLSKMILIPKVRFKTLKKSYSMYQKISNSQKFIECKNMLSKDSFIQLKYQRKPEASHVKLVPGQNEFTTKDVA
jgi:chromosome segregation ATPase